MTKKIVLGILQDSSSAETALDNLSEADFNEKGISIVMDDEKKSRTIADNSGPLKGVNAKNIKGKLMSMGVSENQSTVYQSSLQQGKVVIAIEADEDSVNVAEEMLKDYNTQQIVVV